MRILRPVVRFLDLITDMAALLVCLGFILAGAYCLYDNYLIYRQADDASLQAFKPGADTPAEAEKQILAEQMAGWLHVDGTGIDYPVMQGHDNFEFLNKDPYGDYSVSGSIFLDSRNSMDFSDPYSLLYGHHMEHGLMFGVLDSYLKEGYLETHAAGTLMNGENTYPVRFYAVVEAEATDEHVFGPTEKDDEIRDYVKEHAIYFNSERQPGADERLIALSTCLRPDTPERVIVFGALCDARTDTEGL